MFPRFGYEVRNDSDMINLLEDMKFFCKLISLHSKTQEFNEDLKKITTFSNFNSETLDHHVRLIKYFTINLNVNCLIFSVKVNTQETKFLSETDFTFNDNRNVLHDLCIVFNWFDPKTISDLISLSIRFSSNYFRSYNVNDEELADDPKDTDIRRLEHKETRDKKLNSSNSTDFGKISDFKGNFKKNEIDYNIETMKECDISETFKSFALEFYNKNEFREVLAQWNIIPSTSNTADKTHCQRNNGLRKITVTGFSQGSAVSHALAYLIHHNLDESSRLKNKIRVAGFASPVFCGKKFIQWYKKNLSEDSFNVILAKKVGDCVNSTIGGNGDPVGVNVKRENSLLDFLKIKASSDNGNSVNYSSEKLEANIQAGYIFDPICVSTNRLLNPSKFALHPNLFIICSGKMYRINDVHSEMLKEKIERQEASISDVFKSIISNIANSMAIFGKRVQNHNGLHSIISYYDCLTTIKSFHG